MSPTEPGAQSLAAGNHAGFRAARGASALAGAVGPRPRPLMILLAGPILLGIAIAVTTSLLIAHLYHHALAQGEHEQQSQALILGSQAERALEAVELMQTVLQEHLRTAAMTTPQEFRERLSGPAVTEELRVRARMLPQLDALVIVDSEGHVTNYSRDKPLPANPIDVSDREFFLGLRGQPGRTTFLSEPVQTRSTGKWTMHLARRIDSADGTFLGIIMAALELSYFEKFYASVAAHPDSVISLFRTDGRMLARYPHVDLGLGQTLPRRAYFDALPEAADGSIVAHDTGRIDGRSRLMAVRALSHFPVVIMVSNTMSALLFEWWRQVGYLAGVATVLELMVVLGAMLMLRQVQAQRELNEARAARAEAEASLAVANERSAASRQIQLQNLRFDAALSNMTQALCMLDAEDRLIVGNQRLSDMFGLAKLEAGVKLSELCREAVVSARLAREDIEAMHAQNLALRTERRPASYTRKLADGRALNVNLAPTSDGGWVMTLEDTTEQQEAQARIAHMAHHDALTGLPNRVLFRSRLADAVALGRRDQHSAVLYLDLDHFKSVNDTLGHPFGDALLKAVTERLCAQVRETDTVARLGGDEFAVVQSGVAQPAGAKALASRIVDALGAPYQIHGQQVVTGASIGIAIVPEDGGDPDLLLRNADLALYRAKADGRGTWCFFRPEMDAQMQARRNLELDLRRALGDGQFDLAYQPLMNLTTNTVTGFEALLRWDHPQRGQVLPSAFVPFAEESGLIVPIGRWVLQRACADAVTWPSSMRVAINVSVVQFGTRTLIGDVTAALQDSGLDPSRLELEITESAMLQDTEAVLDCLHELRAMGVGIAMDDFGTGYSSLSYLRRFPFSKVKIDRSFVEGLGQGRDCDAIVGAMIDLCENLGMTVLAEGVETEEQLRMLRAGRCGEAQGYLFSQPRPASEVAAMCRRFSGLSLPETV